MAGLLAGCAGGESSAEPRSGEASVSSWVAYWDLASGEQEARKMKAKLTNLVYFAAYFDEDGHAFLPAEISDLKLADKRSYDVYLSIVNDKKHSGQKTGLKETDFLLEMWQSDAAMESHIAEIITLAKDGGYDGIEIDYERIWRNKQLAPKFVAFIEKLYKKAAAENLKVRVILEPSADFKAGFCQGPEYVVMLYNLYGLHTAEAGPKADLEFIAQKAKAMQSLPQNRSVALATGGCVWVSDGSRKFLSEMEAAELVKKHKAKPVRDERSGCNVFVYYEGGKKFEVWYADNTTLELWAGCARANGIDQISIWRLGSNKTISKVKFR
jgi:spore germination protein YaaH